MKLIKLFFFVLLVFTWLAACQKENSDSSTIPVPPSLPAPVANFTVKNAGCPGPCEITFTNTSTNASTYSWNFGDNTPVNTTLSPSHTYSVAGTYTVTLTAIGAGGSNTHSATVTTTEAPYYVRYQVNDVPINAKVLAATRQTSSRPTTLTLSGTDLAGANPAFRMQLAETFIGWTPGINAYFSQISSSGFVMEYRDAAGQVYTSLYSTVESHSFFSALNYANGGEMAGLFSGTLQASSGETVRITNGTFKLKFSN